MEENVEYEKDKEEDEKVAKKMSEMEEELKMLSYSENLTDQALGQLKDDNERLRGERGSLLQVLYKLSKVKTTNIRRDCWCSVFCFLDELKS